MLRKVLIANRGEIACRVAATLRAMGIRSVAVHSEADRGALHARVADERVAIGPGEPRESYLSVAAILEAARRSGADAIHPGYGFLAENADFAAAVEAAGLVFIGPTAEQVRLLGDKRRARAIAERAGAPVVPGAEGEDADSLGRAAGRIGYPIVLKAALGGGGKGMKVVASERELLEAIEGTRRIALSGFGDAALYLEKRLERARHVEVQVAGDGRGGVIHLFERDCSIQRRHQKVVEECPAPGLEEELRERLAAAAVAVAREVRYRGAGTVEFLLAPSGAFHFLEMNTRLQVEHPVTEMVTGIDLVRLQVEIAQGGSLPAQSAIERRGHAIEARVYAEDPARGFVPQAGRALRVAWARAPFVRVDAGIEAGDPVPVHYDPILAKVAASGPDRARALARLTSALDETFVQGVITNLPFLRALARSEAVRSGPVDTEWVEREALPRFVEMASAPAPEIALVAAALAETLGPDGSAGDEDARRPGADPFRDTGRWRLPGLE